MALQHVGAAVSRFWGVALPFQVCAAAAPGQFRACLPCSFCIGAGAYLCPSTRSVDAAQTPADEMWDLRCVRQYGSSNEKHGPACRTTAW